MERDFGKQQRENATLIETVDRQNAEVDFLRHENAQLKEQLQKLQEQMQKRAQFASKFFDQYNSL